MGAVLLIPTLAACSGSSSGDAGTPATTTSSTGSTPTPGLSSVSFSGDVGKSLTATWHTKVAFPKSTTVTTVVKGTGSPVAGGDTVSTYLWIGDGTTKKVAYSDYTNGSPEAIPNNSKLSPLFTKLLTGATYGSRVVAVTTPTDLLGSSSGNSQLGIGANDSLVVVADIVDKAAVSPTPSDSAVHDAAPNTLPKIVLHKDEPSGLDWTGIAKAPLTTPVQRAVIVDGTGPAVTASDTLTVNYLGEIYRAKSPFGESYSKKPLTHALSGLIPGWRIGLLGVKVGSRVLLEVPPAYGYGAQGSGSAIPGNATLYFVIDVLKAK